MVSNLFMPGYWATSIRSWRSYSSHALGKNWQLAVRINCWYAISSAVRCRAAAVITDMYVVHASSRVATWQARFVFLFRKNGLVPFVITQQNKAHDVSLECSTKQCSAVCALVRIVANKY